MHRVPAPEGPCICNGIHPKISLPLPPRHFHFRFSRATYLPRGVSRTVMGSVVPRTLSRSQRDENIRVDKKCAVSPRMPKTAVAGKRITRFQTNVTITYTSASRKARRQALTGLVGQRDLPLFRIPPEGTKFQPDSSYQSPLDGHRDVWVDYAGLYGTNS